MYAIVNRKTGKWLYGTDFRRDPHTQRTSDDIAMTFGTRERAEAEYAKRQCGKTYEVVAVRIEILE